jgi:hypothetical protein
LFAQQLGTSEPVSAKRLADYWPRAVRSVTDPGLTRRRQR